MKTKTMRGADVVIYVNAKPWAFVDRVEWDVDYGVEPIHGIDYIHPQEITTGRVALNVNLHYWRQHNTAGIEGAGMVPTDDALSRARYCYIQVVDMVSGVTYFEIPKAVVRRQSGSGSAKGVFEGTVSLTGMGWANEF